MSSHAFKKVAPVEPSPSSFSFVRAVQEMGDLWRYSSCLPWCAKREMPSDESTSDRRDAASMACMELGMTPRVFEPSQRELNAYPRIVTDFNGLVWTANRDGHDMDDPSGFDERSKYRAIAMLLEAEEMRNEERA